MRLNVRRRLRQNTPAALARVATLLTLLSTLPATMRAQAAPAPPHPADALHLIPRPREVTEGGTIPLSGTVAIEMPADTADRFAATDLADALTARGLHVTRISRGRVVRQADVVVAFVRVGASAARHLLAAHHLTLDARDTTLAAEGYALVADAAERRGAPARLTIVAASPAGIFYGAQTAKQLVDGAGTATHLHLATIRDWPALRWRGVQDDISRGPVPTLDYQKKQIRTFAAYKINAYSPYFEHTLAYPSHPLIAPPGGAMTPDQVKELVAYAARYHITVIPEQEAFGHLHHVLRHELYSGLGETPHGHVLAPGDPGSLALIRDMFTSIDSLFPGPFVHLGADETFELGRGRTAERVKTLGLGPVYVDFLRTVAESLATIPGMEKKRFLFWGDIAGSSPELISDLPKSMIAVPWEYGAASGFDSSIVRFTRRGMETWVAPGTSSWGRVYPDNGVAIPNIHGFVAAGQRLGATGMINTTWDDDGETLFDQQWYGVLFGGAAGWEPAGGDTTAFASSFGRVFHGDTTGLIDRAQQQLILAHDILRKAHIGNAGDWLFWEDPFSADGQLTMPKIRPVAHALRVAAESALVMIANARAAAPLREASALDAMELGARRIDFIGAKYQLADEVAQVYAAAAAADTSKAGRSLVWNSRHDLTGINGRLEDLRDGFSLLRDEYERAWLRENRPYWLHNVLVRYDMSAQQWVRRLDAVDAAYDGYRRTGHLPPPAALGFPASP